jgi:hypothetical protein
MTERAASRNRQRKGRGVVERRPHLELGSRPAYRPASGDDVDAPGIRLVEALQVREPHVNPDGGYTLRYGST